MSTVAYSTRRGARWSRLAAGIAIGGMVASSLILSSVLPAAADEASALACGADYNDPYIVPADVHLLTVDAYGEQGQAGDASSSHGGGAGGLGAHVTVKQVPVQPGQKIWTGQIRGGDGQGGESGVGAGGRGQWVAFGRPDLNCDFSGVELIAVAGGGGGGGAADDSGPGGTGGNAGQAGNPGGSGQALAGGGGGGGTSTTAGAGGNGSVSYSVNHGIEHQAPGQTGGSLYDGIDPDRTAGNGAGFTSIGGNGSFTVTYHLNQNNGGGGGGGIYGGGGGAASGSDFILERSGNGGGGGGGGGSFPDIAETTLDSTFVHVDFTPIYDTSITLAASPSPAAVGAPLTLTSTVAVSATNDVPALGGGQLSFSEGNTNLGRINVVGKLASETYSLQLPDGLARGVHNISVYYSGYEGVTTIYNTVTDVFVVTHNAPKRATYTLDVQAPQAISFTTNPGTQEAFGATYNPKATSTYGLPVTFSIDPASSSVCTISDGVVSFVGGGTCAILADQAGDDTTQAAPQARQELTVTGAIAQTIAFTSTPPDDLVFGDTYAPTATGGGSGNPVTFTANTQFGGCLMSDGVFQVRFGESCTITANQAGGNGYAPAAPVTQDITIAPTPSQAIITSTAPAEPEVGDNYIVTAWAKSGDDETLAQLSLDATSQGCTLGPIYRLFTGMRTENAAKVTYTGIGMCIVNADYAGYLPREAVAPTSQQRSGVEGKAQVITFTSDVPSSATYGGSAPVAAAGGGSGNPVVLASTTPAVCTVDAATIAFVGAGSCTITANQAGDATTWSAASQVSRTFTVSPAELTVTAPTLTILYGSAVAATGPAIIGFVGTDTAGTLSELPTCDRGWTTAGVGSHATTCSGGADPRYDFAYVAGVATITPATAVVTASSGTTGYGLAIPAVTPAITGFVNGDLALDTAPTCSSGASVGSAVGIYATSCTGAADPDYTVQTVDGSTTITAATLVITPAPLVRTYGDDAPAVLPDYVGLVEGDTLATVPVCTTDVDQTTDVGIHGSSCSGAADANYDIGYGQGTVQVTPADLVVTGPTATTYGAPLPAIAPTYAGLAGGDTAPQSVAVCSTTATSASPVGEYPVECAEAADPNYTISYAPSMLTVAPAPLTITASSWSSTAGSVIPAITPAYAGLVQGELAPATVPECSTTATTASAAGTYPTVCTGASDANYAITSVPGTVTITSVEAPVTPVTPATQVVPGSEPVSTVPSAQVPSALAPAGAPAAGSTATPSDSSVPTPSATPRPTPSEDSDAHASGSAPSGITRSAGPDLTWLWFVGFAIIALLVLGGVLMFRRRA